MKLIRAHRDTPMPLLTLYLSISKRLSLRLVGFQSNEHSIGSVSGEWSSR